MIAGMAGRTALQRLGRALAVGAATLVFLMVTSPTSIPAMMLIVPFVGMFLFLYLLLLELMRFLGPDEDENGALVRLRRPRVMAALLAGFPILLLALQSVVQLSVWDVAIASAILLLAYVYAARGSVLFWR